MNTATAIAFTPAPVGGLVPTDYQRRLLEVPENVNLAVLAGRGNGKTRGIQFLALRHCEQWADRARILFIRETVNGLRELEDDLDYLLRTAYPIGLRSNRTEHVWRTPSGASIECGYLDAAADFHRYQGKSYSLIIVEEAGQFKNLRLVDMLRSCLRVPGVPCRLALLGNSGGRAHTILQQRFIAGRVPWEPFTALDGERWVFCPGTLDDNPHLPKDYEQKLFAACGRDKEMYAAWRHNSWSILKGSMFSDVWHPQTQMFSDPGFRLPTRGAHGFLAADWGISAPAVAFGACWAVAPIRNFPRGSLILLDEVSSADPDDLSVGLQWSPSRFGDEMAAMSDRWNLNRTGCIDDSRGLGVSLIEVLRQPPNCLYLEKPVKGRADGWAKLRELLFNSKEMNGRPGLFYSTRCKGLIDTLPALPRDPLKPEDVDSRGIDHWADSARYAATFEPRFYSNR